MVGERTRVWTDGACSGNPGPGGWAWAVPNGRYVSGSAAATTNQRMEITAALEAVRSIEGPLDVVSDSTYVVHCFRDRWWEGWLQRGWLNKARKPVANRDLWEPLIELVRARGDVVFTWVKGHSGDVMNDLVDQLAVEAATTQQGRKGVGTPTDLGPVDAAGPTGGTAGRAIAGHLLAVAGHKPPELGGYDDNPVASDTRRRLTDVLRAKRALHPELTVLTGLGLGAEQLGAEAALDAGVPFVAVLAFPDPESAWPESSRARYRALLEQAAGVHHVGTKAPPTKQLAGAALARRDAWLARNADEAVVVWDGQDDRVGRLVRSLQDHLGEEEVWIVDPPPPDVLFK